MSFFYLASPYSHKDPEIMNHRYSLAEQYTAKLLKAGVHIYSPIVHCHNMAVKYSLPRDFDFWMAYDKAILSRAAGILVLCIDGWRESRGVKEELVFAEAHNIPQLFLFLQPLAIIEGGLLPTSRVYITGGLNNGSSEGQSSTIAAGDLIRQNLQDPASGD